MLGNSILWALFNRPQSAPDWTGNIKGVSFSPYQKGQDPHAKKYPTPQEIDSDLRLLREQGVGSVRTYSSIDGMETIPELARDHGLRVTAGAWLDGRIERNEAEIKNLIRNARRHGNIDRLMVGNEVLLRGDLTPAQLAQYLRRVRYATGLPVSAAEPWHIWLKHPQLAREVDFIAVHVLPYWEKIPADQAVAWAFEQYDRVRQAFPDKKVMFGEVGWPSVADRQGESTASRVEQARFVRAFLNIAAERGIDYFIMEAFDQPWKQRDEGLAGAHWGLFDVERNPKFAMQGPVVENPLWSWEAGLAALLALAPIALFLLNWQNLRLRGQLFFAALLQAVMSILAWNLFLPATVDLTPIATFVWGLLLPAQIALLLVLLINGLEFSEMLWTRQWRRYFPPVRDAAPEHLPKVSIHLAIHNEPPEMVKQTLNALAALDYPDYEVLVIDNNTKDDQVWLPVKAHCETLGPRFRFYHLPSWPGYKAGALNFALVETAPDARVIGVIDSDYVVRPDWLRATVPYFVRDKVAVVQAPQDNREWQGDLFKTMINWEYNGFFQLGMVQRNERNAIIQHGTMTLVRRDLMDRVNGWSTWTICEDAELGLRLFEQGYEAVYVNEDFGHGLVPETFAGYKIQRLRWAYGAVQILKGHWRQLWGDSGLTLGQRFHFLSGWFPWFADAVHMLFSIAGLFWSLGLILAPAHFDFPLTAFLIPTLGVFLFKVVQPLVLYRAKVKCGFLESLGAALAGMSLTHTIARAIYQGLFIKGKPFMRTPKGENKAAFTRGLYQAWEESQMLLLLWAAIIGVGYRFGLDHQEALVWMAMLGIQSIPYLAALLVSLISTLPPKSAPVPVQPRAALRGGEPAMGVGKLDGETGALGMARLDMGH